MVLILDFKLGMMIMNLLKEINYELKKKISRYEQGYTIGDMQYEITGGSLTPKYPIFTKDTDYELTVSDGKITVRGKRGCRILFYIGSTPYVIKGNNLSTFKVNENNTTDPMQCVSDVITSLDQDLGTLSFKHVFSKIRVVLKTSDGTVVNAFRLTTKEKFNNPYASVNILDRSYTVRGITKNMTFTVSGNTTSEATTDYQNFIVSTSSTLTDLTLLFDKKGKGATIGGSRNWLTDVNNALKLKSRVFQPGHRYSINITVKPSNTDAYLNSGYRADRNYYQWDAYEVYGVGDQRKWSAGNSGGRFGSYFNTSDASQSCRNCPPTDEMQMYIGAGVLIDDGHTGTYQQSYTITYKSTNIIDSMCGHIMCLEGIVNRCCQIA